MAKIDPVKRQVVADIIRRLHQGLTVEEAKSEILLSVGKLTSAEITEIEQGLINDGVSPEEISKFCNVHAKLFESALEQTVAAPDALSHPVNMLKRENREIEKIVAGLRESARAAIRRGLKPGWGGCTGSSATMSSRKTRSSLTWKSMDFQAPPR